MVILRQKDEEKGNRPAPSSGEASRGNGVFLLPLAGRGYTNALCSEDAMGKSEKRPETFRSIVFVARIRSARRNVSINACTSIERRSGGERTIQAKSKSPGTPSHQVQSSRHYPQIASELRALETTW